MKDIYQFVCNKRQVALVPQHLHTNYRNPYRNTTAVLIKIVKKRIANNNTFTHSYFRNPHYLRKSLLATYLHTHIQTNIRTH